MPGQGTMYALLKITAQELGWKLTDELIVGCFVPDSTSALKGRRKSHFCGGAGWIIPYFKDLRLAPEYDSWDNHYKNSTYVDPKINMRLFEVSNSHLKEGQYKTGIRFALSAADKVWDYKVQQELFNTSDKNGVIYRATGEIMSKRDFRSLLYSMYPYMDQYFFEKAEVTEAEVEKIRNLLLSSFDPVSASVSQLYLKYQPEKGWQNTQYFTRQMLEEYQESVIDSAERYCKFPGSI